MTKTKTSSSLHVYFNVCEEGHICRGQKSMLHVFFDLSPFYLWRQGLSLSSIIPLAGELSIEILSLPLEFWG